MDGVATAAAIAPRPPEVVMRLARMGAAHPTRLSFMRILLRRIKAEGWRVERAVWNIDDRGVGRAVYSAIGPERTYSLVTFAHDLPDHLRSDRVIAEAWDATFVLFDGVPTEADLDRLETHVPKQEAGRMSIRELTLSRANRSVRLYSHVIDALADGRQPDLKDLMKVGYLMRTTAVYGSAKFGLADRDVYCDRPELAAPFQAEMLTVWLIRTFSVDIIEHLAQVKGGDRAVRLNPDFRRTLGIGNSTGLGMAPFLLTHPVLIHNWFAARETALARIRTHPEMIASDHTALLDALRSSRERLSDWHTDHPEQKEKLDGLARDQAVLEGYLTSGPVNDPLPWDALWTWGEEALSLEGQELLLALMLEVNGPDIDALTQNMSADESSTFTIDGAMTVGDLLAMIEGDYAWALNTDWDAHDRTARLWYTSAEKLEPRLAERYDEDLGLYEQSLAPARDIVKLWKSLGNANPCTTCADFLQHHPDHRYAVRRVQIVARHPYSEIRDNTIDAGMRPSDMLRAKLSFFGATRFDPRSDRWVRVTMFNGAPFPDEIAAMEGDAWMYPPAAGLSEN
ncbi:MAG: hypothetical protein AAFN27_16345 [Pseudomonadota bacterium]